MPPELTDAVAVIAVAVMLLVAFVHPRGWVETLVGVAAAGAVLATGTLPWSQVSSEVHHLLPVVAFLAMILVVCEVCAVEGLFRAVGALVARSSRHEPRRMLTLTFVAAALTTATLSLDATVVLLTPVMAAAAVGSSLSARPVTVACVRLANSASLLLPVSNLTNLLAVPSLPLSFLGFAALMGPVWVVAISVEYVGQRLFFRDELAWRPREAPPPVDVRMPRFPLVVLVVMLAGFAAASPAGIAPAWVAAVAAVVLAAYARARRRLTTVQLLHAAHAPFAAFVLCLGIVVAALAHGFLRGVLRAMLPNGSSLPELLLVAVVAMVLANVVNNLPATLLLVPLVAPLGVLPVLAALIGLDVGSNLTYVGSLANLLWSRGLSRAGMPASARTFHLLSAYLTLPVLAAAVLVLWLLGRTGLASV